MSDEKTTEEKLADLQAQHEALVSSLVARDDREKLVRQEAARAARTVPPAAPPPVVVPPAPAPSGSRRFQRGKVKAVFKPQYDHDALAVMHGNRRQQYAHMTRPLQTWKRPERFKRAKK